MSEFYSEAEAREIIRQSVVDEKLTFEQNLGVAAQRFYEASGMNLPHTSKPEIVKGLRAALAVFEEPQGEPSDAQVDAMQDILYDEIREGDRDVIRRAWRAAGGVR